MGDVGHAVAAEAFDTHGWCVIRGAVGGSLLDALKAEFDAAWGDAATGTGSAPAGSGETGTAQVVGLWPRYDAVRRHLFETSAGAAAARCLDIASVRLLQDAFLIKPPGAVAGLPWHQDYRYVGYLAEPVAASIRLALTEETQDNGCLWVVDGSHRWGAVAALDAFSPVVVGLDDVLDPSQHAALTADARPIVLAPGDISIHHCFTVHRSGPNRTATPRKTLVAHVFDAAGKVVVDRLPPHVRAHFALDPEGRPVDTQFPRLGGH